MSSVQSFCCWLACLVIAAGVVPHLAQAQSTEGASFQHWTIISNQVRGNECCGAGGTNELKQELKMLSTASLPATFSVRYDALNNPEYVRLLKAARGIEIAGLLEITPSLADAAGVSYNGTTDRWFEAQTVFLIGQPPDARKAIIDAYMERFKQIFGYYPRSTVAWMIDTDSLQYLKEKYGVLVHQITREQWGTDSYTLYGGPPHLPYWPSENWLLIPAENFSSTMPLVVRQTITDPVWVYGDTTSSYTSQPNDYALRSATTEYFLHLFTQAHKQSTEQHTFALVGLENSMAQPDYLEFEKQLRVISSWKQESNLAQVATLSEYATWRSEQNTVWPQLHAAKDFSSEDEQVWILTTPKYRARVRLSQSELFVSDLRVYDQRMSDPYVDTVASSQGWFVVPFVLDGSRFFVGGEEKNFSALYFDTLSAERPLQPPTRLILAKNVAPTDISVERGTDALTLKVGGEARAVFRRETFSLTEFKNMSDSPTLNGVISNLNWTGRSGELLWGFSQASEGGMTTFSPYYSDFSESNTDGNETFDNLKKERDDRYPYLFPQLTQRQVSATDSAVIVSNRFAVVNRNPVRLVIYPRGENGYPVMQPETIPVRVTPNTAQVSVHKQSGSQGYVFVDISAVEPGETEVAISLGGQQRFEQIFFVPDCTSVLQDCIKKPQFLLWYIQNKWQDWLRSRDAAPQFAP